MLNITEVRFKKINKGNFLGYAGICLSDSIVIKDIKLFEGRKGKYIMMPSTKSKNIVRNFAFPKTEDSRQEILRAIIKRYEEELKSEEN